MIETMLSNGMSVSQIAKSVSKSKEEIMNLILSSPIWWLFMVAFYNIFFKVGCYFIIMMKINVTINK